MYTTGTSGYGLSQAPTVQRAIMPAQSGPALESWSPGFTDSIYKPAPAVPPSNLGRSVVGGGGMFGPPMPMPVANTMGWAPPNPAGPGQSMPQPPMTGVYYPAPAGPAGGGQQLFGVAPQQPAPGPYQGMQRPMPMPMQQPMPMPMQQPMPTPQFGGNTMQRPMPMPMQRPMPMPMQQPMPMTGVYYPAPAGPAGGGQQLYGNTMQQPQRPMFTPPGMPFNAGFTPPAYGAQAYGGGDTMPAPRQPMPMPMPPRSTAGQPAMPTPMQQQMAFNPYSPNFGGFPPGGGQYGAPGLNPAFYGARAPDFDRAVNLARDQMRVPQLPVNNPPWYGQPSNRYLEPPTRPAPPGAPAPGAPAPGAPGAPPPLPGQPGWGGWDFGVGG